MTDRKFNNIIKKVMAHNNYTEDMQTVAVCNEHQSWTPCDLVIREYLNNGCGSAKGFLGITAGMCEQAFDYICEHKETLISADKINKDRWNNSGFPLWHNYDF